MQFVINHIYKRNFTDGIYYEYDHKILEIQVIAIIITSFMLLKFCDAYSTFSGLVIQKCKDLELVIGSVWPGLDPSLSLIVYLLGSIYVLLPK